MACLASGSSSPTSRIFIVSLTQLSKTAASFQLLLPLFFSSFGPLSLLLPNTELVVDPMLRDLLPLLLAFPEPLLESPSDEPELLLSESPGSDPGGADILTCFGVFGVDRGGAASWRGGDCCCCCWNGGTHALSGGEGGLGAGLGSSQ